MRFGVLGTGSVGATVGRRLVALGHEVRMGARDADSPKAREWAASVGDAASHGDFADAAGFGQAVVNATLGLASLAALEAAGEERLAGKVLIDIANPLDFSDGFPPTVRHDGGRSLAEQIQARFPASHVVKAMSTMTADLMLEPSLLGAPSSTFVAGDDADAKAAVTALLVSAGWGAGDVVDLGGLVAARGMELYLPLWLSLFQAGGSPLFNVSVVRSPDS